MTRKNGSPLLVNTMINYLLDITWIFLLLFLCTSDFSTEIFSNFLLFFCFSFFLYFSNSFVIIWLLYSQCLRAKRHLMYIGFRIFWFLFLFMIFWRDKSSKNTNNIVNWSQDTKRIFLRSTNVKIYVYKKSIYSIIECVGHKSVVLSILMLIRFTNFLETLNFQSRMVKKVKKCIIRSNALM